MVITFNMGFLLYKHSMLQQSRYKKAKTKLLRLVAFFLHYKRSMLQYSHWGCFSPLKNMEKGEII